MPHSKIILYILTIPLALSGVLCVSIWSAYVDLLGATQAIVATQCTNTGKVYVRTDT